MSNATHRARKLRRSATDAEHTLWELVRDRRLGGHKFRRQAPIGPYIVDFVCQAKQLVVELDGSQHQDRTAYDANRTAWLNTKGYEVVRLWNNEFLQDAPAAGEYILAKLEARPYTSSPVGRRLR